MRSVERASEETPVKESEAGGHRQANPKKNFGAKPVEMTAAFPPPPPPPPRRWVPHRKAEVMAAVRGGLISLHQALDRYSLSIEEYLSWQRQVDRFGLEGLRVNSPQRNRRSTHRGKNGEPDEGATYEATSGSSPTG